MSGNHRGGRSLVVSHLFIRVKGYAGGLFRPELTFSLVLTAAMLTELARQWKGRCEKRQLSAVFTRFFVGAHEHREAAMAVYQTNRYRCLAVLVSSYRSGIRRGRFQLLSRAGINLCTLAQLAAISLSYARLRA